MPKTIRTDQSAVPASVTPSADEIDRGPALPPRARRPCYGASCGARDVTSPSASGHLLRAVIGHLDLQQRRIRRAGGQGPMPNAGTRLGQFGNARSVVAGKERLWGHQPTPRSRRRLVCAGCNKVDHLTHARSLYRSLSLSLFCPDRVIASRQVFRGARTT